MLPLLMIRGFTLIGNVKKNSRHPVEDPAYFTMHKNTTETENAFTFLGHRKGTETSYRLHLYSHTNPLQV